MSPFSPGENAFSPGENSFIYLKKISPFSPGETRFHPVKMDLSISDSGKMRTFTACFGTEEPLQTCGPELKTKLHDPDEPFSTSYNVLVVNRVSEVLSKKQHYI